MLQENLPSHRRAAEQTAAFLDAYRPRAGIEGTNSELKRGQGLRKLRVRGEERVRLSVYFKALACNIKRAVGYWVKQRKTGDITTSAPQNRPVCAPNVPYSASCAPAWPRMATIFRLLAA